jgi:urease accessory protein
MAWHAQLALDYTFEAGRTVARHQHSGPLRILQSLYPEGDTVCHNVLVHPPGGLVGGDTLDMQVTLGHGSHGLVTTPGATRFYRSLGPEALQSVHIRVAEGARLEWLPLENIAYSGCAAENRLTLALEPGAEALGWDVTALGLPLADLPFEKGYLRQHLELPGQWMERGSLHAHDTRLMHSPVGLAGHQCLGTLFFMAGTALPRARREAALELARQCIQEHPLARTAGATSPHPQVIVVRVLAPVVEPAMALLRQVRNAWRSQLWDLGTENPRIWSM